MGQKVNPIGYRLGVYNNWKSKWFAKGTAFAQFLLEDVKIRETIMKKMGPQAAISEIIIERGLGRLNLSIYSARPGVIIGRGGKQLEALRGFLTKELPGQKFKLDIVEVKKADLDANVVAQSIGMPFRRASKMTLQKIMASGAKGAKIMVSGRLDGAEIARKESFGDGSVPLTTLRNDIDYGVYHAPTTFGTVGIKVWINRGERVK